MNTNETKAEIQEARNNLGKGTESTCLHITNILQKAADKCCNVKIMKVNSKPRSEKEEIPHELETKLKWAKHNFENALDSHQNRTGDHNRRQTMIENKNVFKQMIYLVERYKKEDKIKRIAKLENKNPKEFWAHIKRLTKKRVNDCSITPSKWYRYFQDLLNVNAKLIVNSF